MIPQSLQLMLGLCQRAGQLASGDDAAELALKRSKAELLILAEDASNRTQEKFLHLAQRAGVPCFVVGTRDELGTALGKGYRSAVVVQSKDFRHGVLGILKQEGLTPWAGRG